MKTTYETNTRKAMFSCLIIAAACCGCSVSENTIYEVKLKGGKIK
jgi:hypothetical protein